MDFKFLKILKSPDSDTLDLLNRNVIGTPGHGMLYQHTNVADKVSKIAEPYFVSLVKSSRIIGTCCFCKRSMPVAKKEITSFYIRYFTFDEAYRRKFLTGKSLVRKSELRHEVHSLLNGEGLNIDHRLPFVHYAYVDPRNVRSMTLCAEFGFERVRQYTSIIFSRLNPKFNSKEVHELSVDDESKMKTLLSEFYSGFSMFSFENLFGQKKYFVVKDSDGNILAGAQANPDCWKILALPGMSGKLLLRAFSVLPLLRKLINKNYRFLTLEGIFYKAGSEAKLEVLFETLLHRFKINSAIIVVDANSGLYRTLKSLHLGMVNKINPEVYGNVICKFNNMNEVEKLTFRTNPVYISGIDVT